MGKAGDFMSSLGSGLLSAGANALTGGLGGLISGGLSSIASSLFGPSISKQIRLQKEAQMELNEQAARLNYDYGEKSAENAYNRQMEMYERSYEDQSYKAMRKQMEEAGLSVGLMYGQGGSGGGAGSMSGAPQGATGGAIAGDAGAALATSVELKRLQNESMVAKAEANLKNAQAQNVEKDSEGKEIINNNLQDEIDAKISDLRESGRGKWIENNMRTFTEQIDTAVINGEETLGANWTDELYGKFSTTSNSITNKRVITGLVDELVKIDNERLQGNVLAAEEAFIREDTAAIAWKTLAALIGAQAAMKNANAATRNAATAAAAQELQEFLKVATKENIESETCRNYIEAWAKNDQVEFETGGWGKAGKIADGISALAWAFIAAKTSISIGTPKVRKIGY